MRPLLSFFLLFSGLGAQTATVQKNTPFKNLDNEVKELAKVTGLEPLKRVQYDTITRAGVKSFLEERIKEEIRPEDIRIEEIALKRFGFVPKDFDLRRATVDLITEQAAAFYDYRKKKLFLLEGDVQLPVDNKEMAREAQRSIVVHELAHALADQHFDLGKFIKRGRSDDASTARMAVLEGQATWLMMEVMARRFDQSIREMPQMMDIMGAGVTQSMTAQYPVLASAPLYIRASLIFPYNQGLKFQHALVGKLGNAAFTRVFKDPPVSTQQVLHPEKYLAKVGPVRVRLPELARGKEWRTLTEGTLGEFDFAVLIEQYLSKKDAEELAPQWRGGGFGLSEHRVGGQVVLRYASEWGSPEAAKQVFQAWRRVLEGKWKSMSVTSETADTVSGKGDDGLFQVILNGTRVEGLEGLQAGPELQPSGTLKKESQQ